MCKYLASFKNVNYLKDFIVRNTYNSNAIEGSSMSETATYLSLYEPSTPIKASPREIYEANNHKVALELIINSLSQEEFKLDHVFVINLNKVINNNIIYIGGYRLGGMRIIGSPQKFPHPLKVEELMGDFIKDFNELLCKEDVTYKEIAQSHIDYISIHPFPDGNGRTGRLLTNILLLSHDYPPMTILYEDREEYFNIMKVGDADKLSDLIEKSTLNELEYIQEWENIDNGYEEDDYDM